MSIDENIYFGLYAKKIQKTLYHFLTSIFKKLIRYLVF